jgi:HTH-type transcriptional regulator, sugar sensing transcriptional regulator
MFREMRYYVAMENTLAHSLTQLGCNDKQIRFYWANLQLGGATLADISKKARLQRSTTYLVASELVRLGLVSEDHKPYGKLFVAVEPDVVLGKLEARSRQFARQAVTFREALPELRAAHQATTTRPRVRTFEGKAGLTAIWKDLLHDEQEILLWTNQESERLFFPGDTHGLFIKERVGRHIPIRVLAVDNADGQKLQETDEGSLRQTKLLPSGYEFTSETYIYGDKVAILDVGRNIFGVITENAQIATSQRAIFELAWAH